MRKLLIAALAGASALGGAMVAQSTAAQPYYAPLPAPIYEPGYRYDDYARPYYDEGYAAVPVDRFGPDPNGMIAADGHRIKCKLQDDYSYRMGRYFTHRVCD